MVVLLYFTYFIRHSEFQEFNVELKLSYNCYGVENKLPQYYHIICANNNKMWFFYPQMCNVAVFICLRYAAPLYGTLFVRKRREYVRNLQIQAERKISREKFLQDPFLFTIRLWKYLTGYHSAFYMIQSVTE